MRKITIVFIPETTNQSRQFKIPRLVLRAAYASSFFFIMLLGYLLYDYAQLRHLRNAYQKIAIENQGLRGEAQLLISNLEEIKRALQRVQDYSEKLGELTQLKVKRFSSRTGIGPLTPQEYHHAHEESPDRSADDQHLPLGIDLDRLIFRTAFDKMKTIGSNANQNALRLQKLLSTLSQQRSLLTSVPSVTPVDGWITSGFGARISPFTAERDIHMGLDIAAPIGTPIYAPADGVVIFSSNKDGFGNFVMIAHGFGIVSRYGHNAENLVQPGQRISRGDQVATVGMSGRTTGPHLHYEIIINGTAVDPSKFILNMN